MEISEDNEYWCNRNIIYYQKRIDNNYYSNKLKINYIKTRNPINLFIPIENSIDGEEKDPIILGTVKGKCVLFITISKDIDKEYLNSNNTIIIEKRTVSFKNITPHTSIREDHRGKGYTSDIYQDYLNNGYALTSIEQTKDSVRLWDSIAQKNNINILHYDYEKKQIVNKQSEYTFKILTLKWKDLC
jgi:hypothetical protein